MIDQCKQKFQLERFFPVQKAVIPLLMHTTSGLGFSPYKRRDLCVSSPTGSGKTLAYVIPIVDSLRRRIVTRLRALVVIPTKDLAIQVKKVFENAIEGTSLKIGVTCGITSFRAEQMMLGKKTDDEEYDVVHDCADISKIDVLVTTPGRLVEHLKNTETLSLKHLQYLVVDEADRLLGQSFYDWLPNIHAKLAATEQDNVPAEFDTFSSLLCPTTSMPMLQRVLFTATMTRNPKKIASMRLASPLYVAVKGLPRAMLVASTSEEVAQLAEPETSTDVSKHVATSQPESTEIVRAFTSVRDEKYPVPASLSEHVRYCDPAEKPKLVLKLIKAYGLKSVLCFTQSIEHSHRLFLDASKICADSGSDLVIEEFSGTLSAKDRVSVLKRFAQQKISVLFCTDVASRGVDLKMIDGVINCDMVKQTKKYIHRAGRTARAGRPGMVISLIRHKEKHYFAESMTKAGRFERINEIKDV